MHVTPWCTYCPTMEDVARAAAVDQLVRDSDAVPDSVEIVRQRRSGDRMTVLPVGPKHAKVDYDGAPSTLR
jgi:hypothetical protein